MIGIIIREFVEILGYNLVDFKIEVALDPETGEFFLVDGLSLDEMGLTKDGVDYGKLPIRNHYVHNEPEWYAQLQAAQEAKLPKADWPQIPPPPESLKIAQEKRYEEAADDWQHAIAA